MNIATPSVVSGCAASRTSHGSVRVDALVVGAVPELVQHRVHPPLARLDVAEHPHVAFPVDVDAERVLALRRTGVQVAAGQHRAHVEPEPVVGAHGERLEIRAAEQPVEVDRATSRRVLEERVVEMPRAPARRGPPRTARRAPRRGAPSRPGTAPRCAGPPRRAWPAAGPRRARRRRARARNGPGSRRRGPPRCGAGPGPAPGPRPPRRPASTPPTPGPADPSRHCSAAPRGSRCPLPAPRRARPETR